MSRCEQCKHYGALLTPRIIKDDIRIYGFCFKDLRENYGSAYPVYIPDGGVCKNFSKKKEKKIGDLTNLIDKFDNEKIKGLTDLEHVQIFNALKYLEMYQKIGTIEEFMQFKHGDA